MKDEKGFTLVELALVLIFAGFVGLTIASFFQLFNINQRQQETIDNARLAQVALREYYNLTGVFPCPADPALNQGDPNYGVSQCRNYVDPAFNPDACINLPSPNISCSNIGSRDVDGNGANDLVMMGVLPFRTIDSIVASTPFSEAERMDGFGAIFSYAVTESMTNTVLFSPANRAPQANGAIRVIDENDIVLTDPADSAQYVLFSHGDNSRGGYAISGQQIDNCNVTLIDGSQGIPPPGSSVAGGALDIEIENCDFNDAIFVQGIRSLSNNSSYFDDTLLYGVQGFEPLWRRSLSSPPGETNLFNTNQGNVGVGTNNPTHQLHIAGDLTVDESAISDNFCNELDDTTCIDPEALGGVGSTCPNGQAAYAIGNNQIQCRDVNWTVPNQSCAPLSDGTPTFLRGFSNLGTIVCCSVAGDICERQ